MVEKVTEAASKQSWLKKIAVALAYTLWVVVVFYAVQFALMGVLGAMELAGASFDSVNKVVLMSGLSAIVYALTFYVAIMTPRWVIGDKTTKKDLGLGRLVSWGDIAVGPLSFIPYIILSASLMMVATQVIPGFDISQKQDLGFDRLGSSLETILAFTVLVVIAPLAEELLFRGYLYGKLKKTAGIFVAIILVSVSFGVLHGQLNVGIDTFVLSVVLCGLRELTGSVWAGILLHMTKNFIAFYFLFINPITGIM